MASMRDRMLRGELYRADDTELRAETERASILLARLDAIPVARREERHGVMRELFGHVGEGVEVRPGFRCDYGRQIALGESTFVNFDCVMLDVAAITLGASCQLAPRVQLLTASHPLDPAARRAGWEYGRPITLGDNVWLGSGAIVLPGVTIGADTVVGAGAVVTRNLPEGVVAVGTPARVLREIRDSDRVPGPGSGPASGSGSGSGSD